LKLVKKKIYAGQAPALPPPHTLRPRQQAQRSAESVPADDDSGRSSAPGTSVPGALLLY